MRREQLLDGDERGELHELDADELRERVRLRGRLDDGQLELHGLHGGQLLERDDGVPGLRDRLLVGGDGGDGH